MLRLNVRPIETVKLDMFYYHFLFDQEKSLNLSNAHYSDEVNFIATWKFIKSASLIGSFAVAIPNAGGEEFTKGGDKVWLQGMIYASYEI